MWRYCDSVLTIATTKTITIIRPMIILIGPPMIHKKSFHLVSREKDSLSHIVTAMTIEHISQMAKTTVSHIGIICLLLESYYQIRIKSVESQSRIFPISNDYDRIQ